MNKRKKFLPTERLFIARRANHCCEYCLTPADFSPDPFEIEHILPLIEGGNSDFLNLAFACSGCNGRKVIRTYATDPINKQKVRLFNPRTQQWSEHFRWNDDFSFVEGITPEGRATLELLQLNREGLINLRKALVRYGVHPKDTT